MPTRIWSRASAGPYGANCREISKRSCSSSCCRPCKSLLLLSLEASVHRVLSLISAGLALGSQAATRARLDIRLLFAANRQRRGGSPVSSGSGASFFRSLLLLQLLSCARRRCNSYCRCSFPLLCPHRSGLWCFCAGLCALYPSFCYLSHRVAGTISPSAGALSQRSPFSTNKPSNNLTAVRTNKAANSRGNTVESNCS